MEVVGNHLVIVDNQIGFLAYDFSDADNIHSVFNGSITGAGYFSEIIRRFKSF